MNKTKIKISYLIILLSLLNVPAFSQQSENNVDKDALRLFMKVEEGIGSGNVDKFSNYFADKTYLSLASGINGYYSSNQAYYVLKDFLRIYQPLDFRLKNTVTESSTPFASGSLRYYSKGIRGNAAVFISLKKSDDKWRITQITIN